jgi:hypothetical protein
MARHSKSSAPSQSKKFIDKARELGCDEDEAAFEARLKKIAKAPPPTPEKKKPGMGTSRR